MGVKVALASFVPLLDAVVGRRDHNYIQKCRRKQPAQDDLGKRLDAAGDGNDKTAAAANFAKLKNVLKSIRENYPDSHPKQGNQ